MKNFQNLRIEDYFDILRRRIWYVIITAVVVSVSTAIYVRRLPSFYRSDTIILVANRVVPEDYIGSLVRESVNDRIAFVSQRLRSRTFVERIVQEFQLAPPGSPNVEGAVGMVIASTEVGVVSANSLRISYTATVPELARDIVDRMARAVIQLNDSARKETVFAADQFLDDQVRRAESDAKEADEKMRNFQMQHFGGLPAQGMSFADMLELQSQLGSAQAALNAATERKRLTETSLKQLQAIKLLQRTPAPVPRRAGAAPIGDPVENGLQNQVNAKAGELEGMKLRFRPDHPDYRRVERELEDVQTRLAGYRAAKKEMSSTIPVETAAAEPEPIDQALPPLHEMDLSIDFEEAEIRLEIERQTAEIAARQQNVEEVSRRIKLLQVRLNPRPDVAQELDNLVREQGEAKGRYNYLLSKKQAAELAASVDVSDKNETFRVIDEPNLPSIPVKPDRVMLTSAGVLAGLLLGFGMAFAREYVDPTLATEDEAATELKLPVLTSIPNLKSNRLKPKLKNKKLALVPAQPPEVAPDEFSLSSADPLIRSIILDPMTVAAERYRLLRARLSVLQKQRGTKTILITSSIPNEGKTFAACALAGVLAQEPGKRVLLIDADLRTSRARDVFGLDPQQPLSGLYHFLTGTASVEQLIRRCSELNLSFLPTGAVADNPAELLSSPELASMLKDLAQIFDWIIIDAPPVLGLADANLIIPCCDTTLLVVSAARTHSQFVKDAVQRVGRDHLCGVLLNRVRKLKSYPYYGRYYYKVAQRK